MDSARPRKKIIDSTSVPVSRRYGSQDFPEKKKCISNSDHRHVLDINNWDNAANGGTLFIRCKERQNSKILASRLHSLNNCEHRKARRDMNVTSLHPQQRYLSKCEDDTFHDVAKGNETGEIGNIFSKTILHNHIRIADEPNANHIRIADEPNVNHIRIADEPNVNHIRIADEPNVNHVRIADEPNVNHIRIADEPNVNHIRIADEPNVNHIRIADEPNVNHIRIADEPNVNHVRIADEPNVNHIRIADEPNVNHIRIADEPNVNHVRIADEPNVNHIRIADEPNVNHIRIADEPNVYHIRIADEPNANHLRIADEPNVNHVRIADEPNVYHIRIADEPNANHLRIADEPNANHIRIADEPKVNHVRIINKPNTNHVRISNEPNVNHVRISNEPNVNHVRISKKHNVNHVRITNKPDVNHVRISNEPNVNHVRISSNEPNVNRVRISNKPNVNHGRISNEPNVNHVRISNEPNVNHVRIATEPNVNHVRITNEKNVDHIKDLLVRKYSSENRDRGPFKCSVIISKSSSSGVHTITEEDDELLSETNSTHNYKLRQRNILGSKELKDDAVKGSLASRNLNVAFGVSLFDFSDENEDEEETVHKNAVYDAYSNMTDKMDGSPRLLSVEEKWQIIFNEKTRAPIYAVSQYIDYLKQFVDGKSVTSPHNTDSSKRDGMNPVTYLLRKLKLDLKMSYDSFLEEFLKPENKGLELLIKLLKTIQNTGSQQSGSTNMSQLKNYKKTLTDEHDCLLCIKFSLRMKDALLKLLDIPYGLETVSMGLLSTFTKSRGTAIEILTITLSEADGFTRTLECFTVLQLKIGERVRFKSMLNMMTLDSQQNIIFKVSCFKFLNSLLDCSPNNNYRVFLQHELESAGLDIEQIREKIDGRTGLEFDDLRHELDTWKRKYINVDDMVTSNVVPQQHQQNLIDELKKQVQVLSKEKSYLEQQLTAVSSELRNRYEELQRRMVPTKDACVQCDTDSKDMNSIGCQCSHFDEFGNPLKTAALYFGWQDTMENDVMNYYDYQINIQGQTGDEESETDHVVKVEDWLRSHCDSPELEIEPSYLSTIDSRQYFRRQHSVRHKLKKPEFPGNWKLVPKSMTQYPSRFGDHQCHTTNCERCQQMSHHRVHIQKLPQKSVQHISRDPNPGILSSQKFEIQLESQSSDSAIGGSGERLYHDKVIPLKSTVKSEEERLQDLITPDDSASACPEVEPPPDYSTVTMRQDKRKSYQAELSEVLREFEGHLSRYDSNPDFNDLPRSYEQLPQLGNI